VEKSRCSREGKEGRLRENLNSGLASKVGTRNHLMQIGCPGGARGLRAQDMYNILRGGGDGVAPNK